MHLHSDSFKDNTPIPVIYAFAKPGKEFNLSSNRSPHLAWTDAPEGARSFVLTCIDPDVPSRFDDANQEGRSIPADLPRVEFVHWLMANIPPECNVLAEGFCSDGVVAHGKRDPHGPPGSVQGRNAYSEGLANNAELSGLYLGYDGPCPPWNDCLVHRYCFGLYALDVTRLNLESGFTRDELRAALRGHVLAEARLRGTYTRNPDLVEV